MRNTDLLDKTLFPLPALAIEAGHQLTVEFAPHASICAPYVVDLPDSCTGLELVSFRVNSLEMAWPDDIDEAGDFDCLPGGRIELTFTNPTAASITLRGCVHTHWIVPSVDEDGDADADADDDQDEDEDDKTPIDEPLH